MKPTPVAAMILLIQPEGVESAAVRQALVADQGLRLQSVERLPTALARLAGGGVDAILLDISLAGGADGDRLDAFLKLRELTPHLPIIVLSSPGDEELALRAMRAGATDYLHLDQCAENLSQMVRAALDRSSTPDAPKSQTADSRKTARIIAVLGVKGGVGATTVALNVAAELAERHTVVLAEMQPFFGTLLPYFKPHGSIRNLSSLLRVPAAEVGAEQVRACLWRYDALPGLSVLFGPQTPAEFGEIAPGRAQAILKTLAEMADYVVVDLPASLSETNREVVECSTHVALVAEPDPACMQTAGLVAQTIQAWGGALSPGTVIVNRASVVAPHELENLDVPLGVMPSEAGLCLRAQTAHAPLVAYLPESPLAESLIALAAKLEPARRVAA